jgi:hypothetical protein
MDNIKTELRDVELNVMGSGSGQGPLTVSCEQGNEPPGFIGFWGTFRVAERLEASQEGLHGVGYLVTMPMRLRVAYESKLIFTALKNSPQYRDKFM